MDPIQPVFDLALDLPAHGSRLVVRELHRQLRSAIVGGRLQSGMRLPSTRELAGALAVSRNTVVTAYDLLLAEGYVVAHGRAGTQVAARAQAIAAKVIGLPLNKVKVHNQYLGGGFGRRLEVDSIEQAAAIATEDEDNRDRRSCRFRRECRRSADCCDTSTLRSTRSTANAGSRL